MMLTREIKTAIGEFADGLKEGSREGLVLFWSPLITLARHWRSTTETLLREIRHRKPAA